MVKVDPSEVLKCSNCTAVFYDNRELLENAGTTEEGKTYYNTRCPSCGVTDCMGNELVGVPDEAIERYNDGELGYSELLKKKTDEQEEKDKENAKNYKEF